jgi:hypothetical protein
MAISARAKPRRSIHSFVIVRILAILTVLPGRVRHNGHLRHPVRPGSRGDFSSSYPKVVAARPAVDGSVSRRVTFIIKLAHKSERVRTAGSHAAEP